MPTFNDYGIILNSHDLGESDRILNIYTKENGLVRAVAKGVRKSKSKFSGKIEQLSCCYFHFASGKNLSTLCDCEQVNSFSLLRSNLQRLTGAVLFLEIVSNFSYEEENDSHHVYELLYTSLNCLQQSNNPDQDSINFIFNFLSLHGYKPQLDTCVHCSVTVESNIVSSYSYSSILGGILCEECSKLIEHKQIELEVINLLKQEDKKAENQGNNRLALNLLREHIDIRAKNKIKSFDLVFSL